MKNRKKLLMVLGFVLGIGVFFGGNYLYRTYRYKQIVAAITIGSVDLSSLSDGVYTGDFDALLVGSKTKVTMKNHRISDIELVEHKTELGAKAEKIIDTVLEKQTLAVDTVSGATNSSKVILKSIENALKNE